MTINQSDYYRVNQDFKKFWKPIVLRKNGTLDVPQIKRELYDFHNMIENTSKVFYELTSGQISKPNTLAETVIDVAYDSMTKSCKKDLIKRLEFALENSEPDKKIATLEKLIEELKQEVK